MVSILVFCSVLSLFIYIYIYILFQELGFVLQGIFYPTGSFIDYTKIGTQNDALYCVTPYMECCGIKSTRGKRLNWKFPNGKIISKNHSTQNIFWRRGRSSILLQRTNNVSLPTGYYKCQILNSTGQLTRLHIYLHLPGIVQ